MVQLYHLLGVDLGKSLPCSPCDGDNHGPHSVRSYASGPELFLREYFPQGLLIGRARIQTKGGADSRYPKTIAMCLLMTLQSG